MLFIIKETVDSLLLSNRVSLDLFSFYFHSIRFSRCILFISNKMFYLGCCLIVICNDRLAIITHQISNARDFLKKVFRS